MSETAVPVEVASVPAATIILPSLVMSSAQKNEVLMLQRQSLTTQISIYQLQRQVDHFSTNMDDLLNKICHELGIDYTLYSFDLDKLTVSPKGK